MSSHHIIREKQEPALYISALSAVHRQLLDDLLAWSPTLIVDESCVEAVFGWGIKIDHVLAAPINLPSLKRRWDAFQPIDFVQKSRNPLADVFTLLEKEGQKELVVMGMLDAELKQAIQESSLLVTVYHQTRKFVLATSRYEKWFPEGSVLHWECEESPLLKGIEKLKTGAGIVKADGLVSIESTASPIWVYENIFEEKRRATN